MKNIILISIICITNCFKVSSQSIIIGDTLSNNITYNNIKDTTLPFVVKGSSSLELDVDLDNINDVKFFRSHSSSPSYSEIRNEVYSLDSVQFIRVNSNINNCDTLALNDTINFTYNWNTNYNKGNFYYFFSSSIPPPWGQPSSQSGICTKNNTFVGFRKINTNDTIYGWFLINFQGTFTIKSYAINKIISNVSVKEYNFNQLVNVYPNPSKSKITLDLSSTLFTAENSHLSLKTALGQSVLEISFNTKETEIDVKHLENGIYFIEISIPNKVTINKKIIISK